MKSWKIFTLVFVVVTLAEGALARFTSWLSPTTQTGVLVVAAAVAPGLALVAYFDRRARLKSRLVADHVRDEEPARA